LKKKKLREVHDPDRDLRENGYELGEDSKKKLSPIGKYILTSTIAVILMIVFAWQYIGFYSLYFFVAIPLVYLVYLLAKMYFITSIRSYKELLKITSYDKDLVEKLIIAEQVKYPDLTRQESAKRALDKLRYDRSR
jgi:hypothetical protein